MQNPKDGYSFSQFRMAFNDQHRVARILAYSGLARPPNPRASNPAYESRDLLKPILVLRHRTYRVYTRYVWSTRSNTDGRCTRDPCHSPRAPSGLTQSHQAMPRTFGLVFNT